MITQELDGYMVCLDSDNFTEWKKHLKFHLKKQQLEKHVTEVPPTDEEMREK